VTRQCKADLGTSFGEKYLPEEWADATGKPLVTPGLPVGSLRVPENIGADCALLPPKCAPVGVAGAELANMRAALAQESASAVPDDILSKKYFRAQLASGKHAGSKPVGSNSDKYRRRDYLIRINSSEQSYFPNETVGGRPVSTLGAVLHYVAIFVDE